MITDISIDSEGASIFIQLDGLDAWDLLGLLDVVAVTAYCQAHQLLVHNKGVKVVCEGMVVPT